MSSSDSSGSIFDQMVPNGDHPTAVGHVFGLSEDVLPVGDWPGEAMAVVLRSGEEEIVLIPMLRLEDIREARPWDVSLYDHLPGSLRVLIHQKLVFRPWCQAMVTRSIMEALNAAHVMHGARVDRDADARHLVERMELRDREAVGKSGGSFSRILLDLADRWEALPHPHKTLAVLRLPDRAYELLARTSLRGFDGEDVDRMRVAWRQVIPVGLQT